MEVASPAGPGGVDQKFVVRFTQVNGLRAGDVVYRLPVMTQATSPGQLVRVRRPQWVTRCNWVDAAMLLPHELAPVAPWGNSVAYAVADVASLTHGRVRWLVGVGRRAVPTFSPRQPRFWDSPGAIICFLREAKAVSRALTFVRFDKTAFAYVDYAD